MITCLLVCVVFIILLILIRIVILILRSLLFIRWICQVLLIQFNLRLIAEKSNVRIAPLCMTKFKNLRFLRAHFREQ